MPEDVICSALVQILDKRNHPILIHCNKGKVRPLLVLAWTELKTPQHRTGCLIGCIRRLQSWSLTSTFDESVRPFLAALRATELTAVLVFRYRRFSNPKSRAVDQQFIDLFDLAPVWEQVTSPRGGGLENLPEWGMLTLPRGKPHEKARIRGRDSSDMWGL